MSSRCITSRDLIMSTALVASALWLGACASHDLETTQIEVQSVAAALSGGGGNVRVCPASTLPPLTPPPECVPAGEELLPGDRVISGDYELTYQTDGNLVVYRSLDMTAMWSSKTYGTRPGRAVMQGDGNLVVYDANNVAVWHSHTYGNPGSSLGFSTGAAVVRQGATEFWRSGDPRCTLGVSREGNCCKASCGVCGGTGCSGRPGGYSACCMGAIQEANRSCGNHVAPCVMP